MADYNTWRIIYLSKQKLLFYPFCENILSNIFVHDGKSISKDKQCAPSCGWISQQPSRLYLHPPFSEQRDHFYWEITYILHLTFLLPLSQTCALRLHFFQSSPSLVNICGQYDKVIRDRVNGSGVSFKAIMAGRLRYWVQSRHQDV